MPSITSEKLTRAAIEAGQRSAVETQAASRPEKALKAANVPAAAIRAAVRFAAIIQSVALALEATAVDTPAAAE